MPQEVIMHLFRLLCLLSVSVLTAACGKDSSTRSHVPDDPLAAMESIQIAPGFDFSVLRDVQASIHVLDPEGGALSGVRVDLLLGSDDGELRALASGATDLQGLFATTLSIPADTDQMVAQVKYVGIMPAQVTVPIRAGTADHVFGGAVARKPAGGRIAAGKPMAISADYLTLGGWDASGVPNYLEPVGDQIDGSLLQDINTSLPEGRPVPEYNPEYLQAQKTTTVLLEPAEVWVTFVHEGAGWLNSLGFYTYARGNPPASIDEVDNATIIFPNVSALNSGGGLLPGDKVYLGSLPADTEIGWFLVARGWSNGTVGNGAHVVYSDPVLNPETDPQLRQHNVMLNDPDREILLLSFEDLRRDTAGCDNDFNDAVFFLTATPYIAVDTQGMPAYKPYIDSDNDGIEDYYDEFPVDPDRAFRAYFPAQGQYATLAFEDQWPQQGDYDFNDLVVAYNMIHVTNAANWVVDIDAGIRLRAAGASFSNAFGFVLPLSPGDVAAVSGTQLTRGLIDNDANGVEGGQGQAVVVVFDDAYALATPASGYYLNTQLEAPVVAPVDLAVHIELSTPTQLLQSPPYNPFAIVNGVRGHEVHLAGHAPTDKADPAQFNTGDDASASAGYYRTTTGLPWAMHVASGWQHPLERIAIVQAYSHFAAWAESGGAAYSDWYLAESGQASLSLLYPLQ
jgi:LruC domain-containing protein